MDNETQGERKAETEKTYKRRLTTEKLQTHYVVTKTKRNMYTARRDHIATHASLDIVRFFWW